MANYIKTLKEDNGDVTYPVTKAGAVYLNNGTDAESKFADCVTADEIAVTSASTPLVGTNMISDKAVTADKIDWTTMNILDLTATPTTQTTTATGWFAPTWYRREYENGRIVYTYTGASINVSFNGGGWGQTEAIYLPIQFNSATMGVSVSMSTGDAAVTVCCSVVDGASTIHACWTNQYGSTVTTKVYANVMLEVFA